MNHNDIIYNQPIVIDNGSCIIKSGFSRQDKPAGFEYNLTGMPKYDKIMITGQLENLDKYIGNRAQSIRGLLRLQHPMNRGVVDNWDDMELLWWHIFNDTLNVQNIEEHPLLITEAPLTIEKQRHIMCERLFETFNIPSLYVANPSVLSLYASGNTTGCVVDCGDGYCSSTPIYEGFVLPASIRKMEVGGRDITEHLQFQIRKSSGISLYSSNEKEIVRTIKEKVCYISEDFNKSEESYYLRQDEMSCKFKLPDGKELTLNKERFRSPEVLFNPQLMGLENENVSAMCFESISKVDLELRPKLFSNILLTGGSTLFKGFGSRLLGDLQELTNNRAKIKILAPPERKYTSWIGGSILTGLSTFKNLWVTKSDWEESSGQKSFF
ncbi:actin-related protein 1 NDAI_0B04460 [Naumovozyma dairenensis CBS 421]|uniref:Centractin n=1 Tax=Naumovozyma dairenensis (strain ATCC 10597 / BCRC 20456 / CBS 421 / NBRC 0211 / NRRL Y-12639) TaxID=1071378 RepID=G0W6S0_NAUDC|nr:hypothetical protein NDAI_0B04460 [Naumovozyma dairenensis CBS 421]CCD23481.1 hypothetical protein NDAI_0B04460 [Naumovozyma dairenensis CBS 421]